MISKDLLTLKTGVGVGDEYTGQVLYIKQLPISVFTTKDKTTSFMRVTQESFVYECTKKKINGTQSFDFI